MSDISNYESRSGDLTCTCREVFEFVTDIRNFEQFIPPGSVENWESGSDRCSFKVPNVGTINVGIDGREPYNKVIFRGNALNNNDFTLILNINDGIDSNARVKVLLEADLNPILKMMANKPINRFLEILITGMENFRGWRNTI